MGKTHPFDGTFRRSNFCRDECRGVDGACDACMGLPRNLKMREGTTREPSSAATATSGRYVGMTANAIRDGMAAQWERGGDPEPPGPIKLGGDRLLIVGAVPSADPSHVDECLRRMRSELSELRTRKEAKSESEFSEGKARARSLLSSSPPKGGGEEEPF